MIEQNGTSATWLITVLNLSGLLLYLSVQHILINQLNTIFRDLRYYYIILPRVFPAKFADINMIHKSHMMQTKISGTQKKKKLTVSINVKLH